MISAFGVEHGGISKSAGLSKGLNPGGARTVAQMLGKDKQLVTRGQAARGNSVRVLRAGNDETRAKLGTSLARSPRKVGPTGAAVRRSAGY